MYFKPATDKTIYKVDGTTAYVIWGMVYAIMSDTLVIACGEGATAVAAVKGSHARAIAKGSTAMALAEGAEAVAISSDVWNPETCKLDWINCSAEAWADGAIALAYGSHARAQACAKGAIVKAFGMGKGNTAYTLAYSEDEDENY